MRKSRGSTAAHFALEWVLNSAPSFGHLRAAHSGAVAGLPGSAPVSPLTAEDEALVDRMVPPGHASTPGYTDPNYPVGDASRASPRADGVVRRRSPAAALGGLLLRC
jgi:hypothetical protein